MLIERLDAEGRGWRLEWGKGREGGGGMGEVVGGDATG